MKHFNTKRFINVIKDRRALWDSSLEGYKNKELKKTQWLEVAEQFQDNFNSLDARDKELTVKDLQAKWKHIRDSYTRSLRNQKAKSGDDWKEVRPYVYAKQLDFLKEHSSHRQSESGVQNYQDMEITADEDGDTTEYVDFSEPVTNPLQIQQGQSSDDDYATNDQNYPPPSACIMFKRKRSFVSELENLDSPNKEEDTCDDMHFFKSLLPFVKNFPQDQKMKFRMDVMRLVMDYSSFPGSSQSSRPQAPPSQSKCASSSPP